MSGLRSSGSYSLEFKLKVLEDYRSGLLSKSEISKKYGIQGHSTITKWLRKLEGKTPLLAKQTDDELRQRIKDLEKLLEYEKLRRLVAEQTIKVAERELKISIRKKFDSKQSKK
jgi:transposase-like protein